jgi:hypothetical protein
MQTPPGQEINGTWVTMGCAFKITWNPSVYVKFDRIPR